MMQLGEALHHVKQFRTAALRVRIRCLHNSEEMIVTQGRVEYKTAVVPDEDLWFPKSFVPGIPASTVL